MGCLGIDTSCYRTSVAYVDEGGYRQQRKLLLVPPGKRGLMQSEMVFQHVQNLPILIQALCVPKGTTGCVCASTKPRPAEGSYMPAFTVGEGLGRSLSTVLGVPFFETSHQQGHLRAAMLTGYPAGSRFLALHLSGGTTELLLTGRDLGIELLGGTSDLNAGQLIDRVGVALGCSFPAGPELEALAMRAEGRATMPTSIKGLSCSLSGAEAQAMRMIEAGEGREQVAAEVFSFLARTLAKLISLACQQTGTGAALLSGGVASSALLKRLLPERLHRLGARVELFWAAPELSGDNAVGVAHIGYEQCKGADAQ